jgi:hypothetical protein
LQTTVQKLFDLKKALSILFILALTVAVSAQELAGDSITYERSEMPFSGEVTSVVKLDSVWHPDPKKATMLSAAIPGAGQIYNGQWWKVPILYAGIGTMGYFIYWNNNSYVRYRNAYIDFVDDDPSTTRYELLYPTEDYEITDDTWFEQTIENRRDNYRRDRDFLIICMVGIYALNVIEANVAAHLHDFDVSDDLSMQVAPNLDYDFMSRKPRVGVSLKFTLNK